MRAWYAVPIVLLAGLAGCLGGEGPADGGGPPDPVREDHGPGFDYTAVDAKGLPVPLPLCRPLLGDEGHLHDASPEGLRCNFEMTPDEGRQGNEVTIAVDPKDPRNIVGGAKDYYPPDAGDCVWDGVYVTHDGGATAFHDRSFDGSPWRLAQGDAEGFRPNYASQFWCTTDPVAYFDVNGNLYYLLMAYQADPVTGSKTGEDVLPQGGLNDWAFNRAVQIVAISDDGGDTFHTFSPVLEGSYPVAFHDKGWLAASDDGTVHVGWLAFVEGNLYFRSTDGGRTWTDPVLMAPFTSVDEGTTGVAGGQGTFVDVGPGPEVYYSWAGGGGIALRRSTDRGATWDDARVVMEMVPTEMANGLSPRDRRDLQFPALATDRNPDSPLAGAVYFAWQDGRDGGADILFTASFDGGGTFTGPVRVDGDTTGAFQFFPAVSVSPGGVVDVTWLDMRSDPGGDRIDQFYAYSLDGGRTWSDALRVRDVVDAGWDPALSHHQNGMVFIGDYIDIDSSWQAAHPVWPDTRSGEVVDVYTATLRRPMFAEGWDAEARAEAETTIRALTLG